MGECWKEREGGEGEGERVVERFCNIFGLITAFKSYEIKRMIFVTMMNQKVIKQKITLIHVFLVHLRKRFRFKKCRLNDCPSVHCLSNFYNLY